MSYTHSTFFFFFLLWFTLTVAHDESVFYIISVSGPDERFNTRPSAVRLITETEETECFACKILPMTSTYGQGDFSVKLGREQEMRRVQRSKRLQQLWLRWDALSEKNAGYADAIFFFFYRGGISLINSWIRKQLLPCYQFLLSAQFITQKWRKLILVALDLCTMKKANTSRPLFLFCTQFGLVRNKWWLIFLNLQILNEG